MNIEDLVATLVLEDSRLTARFKKRDDYSTSTEENDRLKGDNNRLICSKSGHKRRIVVTDRVNLFIRLIRITSIKVIIRKC